MAAPVSGLYQATVSVSSQSQDLRPMALQQALSQVFTKVNGSSAVVKLTPIQTAISNPENYLLAYSYSDGVLPNGNTSLFLQANFDAKSIQNALKSAGQAIWGKNRPLVLLWVAVTQNNSPATLVSSNNRSFISQQFKSIAKQRALPIMLPILDLTDLRAISVTDISSANITNIEQASNRYGCDAILAVNLQQMGEQTWNGNWMLLAQGNSTTWQTNGMNLEQAINAGMNAITDNLAAKFSISNTNITNSEVQLTIINIKDLNDYAKVTQYLKGLSIVKQVEVNQVQPTALIYTVTVVGGEAALQQALSLDHRLQPVTVVPGATGAGSGLVYQWIS